MKIEALFITRHYATDVPELLEAWDEWSIDANPDGWDAARAAALAAVGEDLDRHAVVTVTVDEVRVLEILNPAGEVAGVVTALP